MNVTFNQAIEVSDPIFLFLFQIMKIGCGEDRFDINKERKFLSVVNQILDYYIGREGDALKIPVVYFPICNENSQELCEEFVTIKLGFFANDGWRKFVCNQLSYIANRGLRIRSDENAPQVREMAMANYKYEVKLGTVLSETNSVRETTSLIYSNFLFNSFNRYRDAQRRYNRRTVNKYWYLARAINGNYLPNNDCPLSLITDEAKTFYELMTKKIGKKDEKKVENLVFFPCNSPDGDYSEFCSRIIQKTYLDNFVKAGSGLRNVFIFRFSRKPFRLRRLLDVKNVMKDKIHPSDDSFDCISFNYEESALLFNQEKPTICNITIGGDYDDMRQDFELLFNDVMDSLDNKYTLRRNEVAMCATKEMANRSKEILTSEAEIDETILSQIFTINRELWDHHSTILTHFLDEPDLCVVVGHGIDEDLKKQFKNWLIQQYNVRNVQFATFGDLKGKLVNGKYQNEIQSKRILILSFRNDYTESIFHKYPNSFDPICINKGQKALVVSNMFIMRSYFDWGHYNYTKALKKILKSEFRKEKMTLTVNNLVRPHNELIEDFYDEDNDRNYRQVQQITITYPNSSSRSFNRSEWMFYQLNNDERAILPLSDLADLYSDSVEGLAIQPISSLISIITDDYLETKKAEDTNSEKLFKEQPIYALTEEQKDSNVQLWKILLQRKIDERTIEVVFDEIMSNFSSEQRISFNAFSQWSNEDYGLPRSNRMQEYLIRNYLGIKDPYLRVVRRLKAKSRNNTEAINANIRHFLSVGLLSNDYSAIYNSLNEEIRDLLSLESTEDVKALIELVSENIKLDPIKSISK